MDDCMINADILNVFLREIKFFHHTNYKQFSEVVSIRNENLITSKVLKNDEYYTLFSDVESELSNYQHHFYDKIIYLPCDNPKHSAFWKYFHVNFSSLNLKQLTATYYKPNCKSCRYDYYGGSDDIIATYKKQNLNSNGDFRSKECQDIMNESDIVVTNEPFSLFRDMISLIMKYNKQFLIIGNFNAVTYKETFPLLQQGKIWLGYNSVKQFMQPDGNIKNFGNIYWFTNLDVQKNHQLLPIKLNMKYTKESYPKYCNYDAININKLSTIPCDYCESWEISKNQVHILNQEEWNVIRITKNTAFIRPCKNTELYKEMIKNNDNYKEKIEKCIATKNIHIISYCTGIMGVPITFLNKYNPKQFEIIGTDLNNSCIGIDNIPQKWLNLYLEQGNKGHYTSSMHSLVYIHNGKAIAPYKRILIKRIDI